LDVCLGVIAFGKIILNLKKPEFRGTLNEYNSNFGKMGEKDKNEDPDSE
jgi:hypothetical protein